MKKRIFYHDTDCGGVVYHANYLKFLEEARTEYLENLGLSVKGMLDDLGIMFVVRRQEMEYKRPARYDDTVDIATTVTEVSPVRLRFSYELRNQKDEFLARGSTDLVSVGADFKLREMPADLLARIPPPAK